MGSNPHVHTCIVIFCIKSQTHSVEPLIILPDLQLELLDSLGHAQNFLFEGGFVRLQIAELLLQSLRLRLLVTVMPAYFFNDSVQLVGQRFPRILAFHSQYGLKCLFLWSEDLYLFLVNIQILCQLPHGVIQVRQFALQVRRVILLSCCIHAHDWEARLLKAIALLQRDYINQKIK